MLFRDNNSYSDIHPFSGEEDISKLQPDLLLYKASAAHNLPVMLEALALGADKNWINPDDRNRSPIHASVLSVSINLVRLWCTQNFILKERG